MEAREATIASLQKKCVDTLNALEDQARKELQAAIAAQKDLTTEELARQHTAELQHALDTVCKKQQAGSLVFGFLVRWRWRGRWTAKREPIADLMLMGGRLRRGG